MTRTTQILLWTFLLVLVGIYATIAVRGRREFRPAPQATTTAAILLGAPTPVTSLDPVRGPKNAAHTIIEFGDLTCESCRAAEPILRSLLTTRNDVKLAWRDFPIENLNRFSRRAALAARCAQDQNKFWEFHDALLAREDILSDDILASIARDLNLNETRFAACLKNNERAAVVTRSLEEAAALQSRGAPEFWIDGVRYDGAITMEGFLSTIARE